MRKINFKSAFKLSLIVLPLAFLLSGCSLQDPSTWSSIFNRGTKTTNEPITLTYWGLFEPAEVIVPLIREYTAAHPNVTIDYALRSFSTLSQYRELLLSRLRQGSGPDIFRVHLTWLPSFVNDLAPIPPAVMSEKDYTTAYYPVLKEWSSYKGSLYSLPLQYDGLVLFTNDDALSEISAVKPQTWEDFRRLAVKLTKPNKEPGHEGEILRAGAAIGNASNINHASDLFGLMFAQSDLSFPGDLSSQAAQDALTFYTNFIRKDKVWNANFPPSVQAFARGQVAMIFAPSWRLADIVNLSPTFKFSMNPVPQAPAQLSHNVTNTNWASFWVETVSNRTKNPEVAWDFLKFLSSKESLKKIYALEAQGRPLGQPYPRTDLASDLSVDPKLTALLSGAPTAKTAPITDISGNDPFVDAINLAIESNLKGSGTLESLKTAQQTIERLLGLSAPSPTPAAKK